MVRLSLGQLGKVWRHERSKMVEKDCLQQKLKIFEHSNISKGENICIFCKIVKGEIKSEVVMEDDNFLVIKDINPQVKGHSLLIPKGHYKTIIDMPSTLSIDFMSALKEATIKLMKENNSDSFNLAVIGEDVDHAHIHILPRRKNDGYKGLFN